MLFTRHDVVSRTKPNSFSEPYKRGNQSRIEGVGGPGQFFAGGPLWRNWWCHRL